MSVKSRSVLGVVFLLLGVAVIAVELWAHKRLDVLHSLVGFGAAVLGAWMIEPSSTAQAVTNLATTVKGFLPGRGAPPPQ